MQFFMDFLILQIFMGFMQGYESSKDKWYKDKWYKLPLVGFLPHGPTMALPGVRRVCARTQEL